MATETRVSQPGPTRPSYAATLLLAGVWVAAYYAFPNVMFGRVSPGFLLIQHGWAAPVAARAAGLVLLMAMGIASLWVPVAQARLRDGPPLWALAAVYLLPVLLIAADSLATPRQETVSMLCAICTGLLVARLVGRDTPLLMTILGLVAAGLAVRGYALGTDVLLSGGVRRAAGTFQDPNQLYVLLLTAVPFTLALAHSARRPVVACLCAAAAGLVLCALILAWFRGATLGLAASLALLTLLLTRSRVGSVAVLAACLLLFAVTVRHRTASPSGRESAGTSNRARMAQMLGGWQAFCSAPLLGVGVGQIAIEVWTTEGGVHSQQVLNDPKNEVLHWLAERGVVGGVLLALFAWSVWATLRSRLTDPFAVACLCAWVGLMGAGLVDTPFGQTLRYSGNWCFGLLLGFTAALARGKAQGTDDLPTAVALGK